MASNGGRINFQVGFNVDKSGLNSLKSSLQSLQKIKIADFSGTREELRQVKDTAATVQAALQKAFNVNLGSINLNTFNQQLQRAGLSIDKVYQNLSKAGGQGKAAFVQMSSSIMSTNLQLRETTSLVSKMGQTMANTVKWGITSSIMQGFTNSVRQAFQYVEALDASLTDIRIVTGDSTEQMRQFAQEANNAAQSLGRSTMDYTRAALTFYQQGLDDQSVAARTQATLQAQNITGAGDEMADYLTAVWNGYKVANEQAELYVDRLAAVADSSASNMAQLATAMSKVAATANAMGVDVDQLNAQIATIIATTRQAPQTVGNALKTIFARINDIQAGTEDAEVSLGHYTGAMAELGINVLDTSGHLRDTGQVMEEIGQKWQTMSREQQIYLARTMAGQRQYNNLIALFDNWGRYTELVNVSMDSQGTLMEKNSRYMDSMGAKLQQLGAAGEKVKDALIDEEDMKGLITAATNIVNVFGSFIQSIGGARGALLAFGSIAMQVFSGTISKQISNLVLNIQNARQNQSLLNQQIEKVRMLSQSKGYSEGLIKDLVNQKAAIQSYYSVMSTEQIKAYNQLHNRYGVLQSQNVILEDQIKKTETLGKYIQATTQDEEGAKDALLGVQHIVTDELKPRLEEISNIKLNNIFNPSSSNSLLPFQQVAASLRQLKNQTGQTFPEIQTYFNKLKTLMATPLADRTRKDFQDLKDLLLQIGNVSDRTLEAMGMDAQKLAQKLGISTAQAEALLAKMKQMQQQKALQYNIKSVMGLVAGLGQVASGINSIVNLTKIWKNENLSFGEKVLQTFTNLSMTIGMFANGLMQVINNAKKLVPVITDIGTKILGPKIAQTIANQAVAKSALKAAGAEGVKSAADVVQAGTAKSAAGANAMLAASIGSIIAVLAPLVIAAGAVAIAIKSFSDEWHSASNEAARAAEKAAQAKEQYDELKQSFQELKSSFEDYHTAQDALDNLTRGTQEWRDALLQANQVVLELLNTYPQLSRYIDRNQQGRLTISEQGIRTIMEQQQQALMTAQGTSIIASNYARQAATRADAAQLGRAFGVVQGSGLIDYTGNAQIVERIARTYANNLTDVYNEEGILDTAQLAELAGVEERMVQALSDQLPALLDINANLEANQQTERLGFETLANSALSLESSYLTMTQQQQRIATTVAGQQLSSQIENLRQQLFSRSINERTSTAQSSMQQILDRYIAATGDQRLRWSTEDAITKQGNELIFHLVGSDGEPIDLSQDLLYDAIAFSQAQQIIRDSTLNSIQSINDALGDSSFATAIQEWMAGGDFSNLTQDQLSLIQGYYQTIDETVKNQIAALMNMTREQLDANFEAVFEGTGQSLERARETLSPHLSHIFDWILETSTADLSIGQQKNLIEQLQNTYNNFGAAGIESLQNFYNSVNDFDAFEQLYEQFDPLTDSTEAFIATLQEEGITTGLTVDALNALIDARREELGLLDPQGAYNTIQGMERFNYNDLIPTEDFQEMENAFEELGLHFNESFFRMELGGYRFIGSAQEWIDFLNNASFQQAEQKISELYDRLTNIDSYRNSDFYNQGGQQTQYSYLSSDITTNANASYEDRMEVMQAQFQALQAANLMTDQLQNIWIEIRDGNDVNAQQAAEVLQAITSNAQIFNNPDANFDDLTNQLTELQQQVSNTLDQLDADVDQTAAGTLADMLRTSEGLQGLSDDLQTVAGQAERTAEEWLRYDHALEEFFDNYDTWNDVLNNGTLAQQAEILPELQNAYSDLLNLPIEGISDSFARNTDNLELFRQAAYGSEQAYNQLLLAAQQDIIAHIGIDPADQVNFQNSLNNLQSWVDQGLGDIEAGAYIDDTQAIAAMNELINSADMTAQQAQALLGSMGIDATVESVPIREENSHTFIGADPIVQWENIEVPSMFPYPGGTTSYRIPRITYKPTKTTQVGMAESNATALRVTSASKSSGGNIKFNNTSHGAGSAGRAARAPRGGGGGGGKGGSSKASQPSIQKSSQDQRDPYHDINRLLDKQSQKLKKLQDQDKKLVNRDRLNNINAQNKALEEQADLLENKLAIAESEQIRLRNQLLADTNGYAQFGRDGELTNFNQMLANAQQQYNNYIAYYNTLTKEQQDAEKDRLELQKERYERVKDTAKEYEETLDLQRDLLEQINEAQEKQYENLIKASKIKVDLSIDAGDAERDWLDFENKVIKKLDKNDFLGNAKANVKELMSYFDSDQVQKTAKQIQSIRNQIAIMERGGTSSIYGNNLAQAKEDLEQYMKQQMDDLEKVQSLVDKIKDNYLDGIKQAKKQMDDQIDQYERVNDLIEHNVKLTQMLYGDKAYDTMNKYYELQERNNKAELDSLKKQQDFWQQKMNNEVVGSDAWNEFKNNLDNVTDDLNKKLEDMIDNLSDKWQNRVDGIIDKLNNSLTSGRGLDYLDEQWDYINDFDDNFLDAVESKLGIQQVQNLYEQAVADTAGDAKQQQRITDLMNQQIKILREKDKLTEYDVERAKAVLDVEKARMALEDARNNKTKMRLRRDSQGNYTYQYVADEEKLDDLQQALNDAQLNLYNQDKQHYKQNLDKLYDTYKDYIEKMRDLTAEYNATQDEEERARIQARIDLLKSASDEMMASLTEDNRQLLNYLDGSTLSALGIDGTQLTGEEIRQIVTTTVPQASSKIQDLTDSIAGQGGLLQATAATLQEIVKTTDEYDKAVADVLEMGGTSLDVITTVVDSTGQAVDNNIVNVEKLIAQNDELIKSCDDQISAIQKLMSWLDQYMNKVMDAERLIANLRAAYNTDQVLNDSNLRALNEVLADTNLDTTTGMDVTSTVATNLSAAKKQIDALISIYERNLIETLSKSAAFDTGGYTGSWEDQSGKLAILHDKELVLNENDTTNILAAVQVIRDITSALSGFIDRDIGNTVNDIGSIINTPTTEHDILDQNVHIEANFPNVTQHTQIEQAFNNLVNIASQYAARPATV